MDIAMTESPLFNKVEADRILKRAAEIEGAEDTRPMSIEELRAVAGEAGFGNTAVERAIAEALQTGPTGSQRPPVAKRGIFITRLTTTRTLPIALSSDQLLRAVRLFHPYREGPANVSLREHRITWRDRKKIHFDVRSGASTTEIHVSLAKPLLRKGRWMGHVKAAADRLEDILFMVAARERPALSEEPRTLLEAEARV